MILNQSLGFLVSSLHRVVTKPSMRCLTIEKVESESLQRRKGNKMCIELNKCKFQVTLPQAQVLGEYGKSAVVVREWETLEVVHKKTPEKRKM